TEYSNLKITKRFDIENIIYLNDEIFQNNIDNEKSQNDKYINDNSYIDNNSNIIDNNISENLSVVENDNENSESLPIAF
ncbi:9478_t:CDS:2, partial [Cetraspora pellucida]